MDVPFPVLNMVVSHGDEFLVVRHANAPHGVFTLPDGHIRYGETVRESILRELKEQFGLDCSTVKFLHFQDHVIKEKTFAIDHFFYLTYIARVKDKFLHFRHPRHEEGQWIHKDNINALNIAPEALNQLRSAAQKLKV